MECLRKPIKIKKQRIRKSGFEDMFFVIIIILAVILFVIVLSKVWSEMKDPLDEGLSGALPAGSGVNITSNFETITSTVNLFDSLLPFLLIGIFAFVLIGASIYMNHPIMLFVGIIILGVAVLLAVVYSNVYHQIAETDEFATTTDSFPISDKLMEFLPYIVFIMAIGIGIGIIYFKGGAARGL